MWGVILRGLTWIVRFLAPTLGILKGFKSWVLDSVVPFILGSKIWATATFIVIAALIVGALGSLVAYVINSVLSYLVSQTVEYSGLSDQFAILGQVIDYDTLGDIVSNAFACYIAYLYAVHSKWIFYRMVHIFGLATKSWKT